MNSQQMHDSEELRSLQAWVQAVITHPGGITEGIESDAARQHVEIPVECVEDVITRSSKQSAVERLSVYGNAYFARLIGCMEQEFPAIRHAVGANAFAGFVTAYLQRYPSTSYSLGDLHQRFPDFLAESRPQQPESATPNWIDFVIDLATLESTYCDVFDGPGEEHVLLLSPDALATMNLEQSVNARLQFAHSLRLLHVRFPVHRYATAVRKRERAEIPKPSETWLAIHRREFIVRRRPLSRRQFTLLRALQSGCTVLEAIQTSMSDSGAEVDAIDESQLATLSQQLQADFRTWAMEGYFLAVT